MRPKLHISVPNPCTQQWSDMTFVSESERHCSSCDKVIIDFTEMSDGELLDYFRNNNSSCGMFAPHQLNKVIQRPKKKRTVWAPILALQALLAFSESKAQPAKSVAEVHVEDSSDLRVKVPLRDVIHTLKDTLIATGRLLRIDDSLREIPLAAAMIIFNNDSDLISCATDEQGYFKIKLPHRNVGDTVMIEIRASGFAPYFTTMILSEPPDQSILRLHTKQIQAVNVVGGAVASYTPATRTSFVFWRVFHPGTWWW